jgi:hypothetical protein
MASRMGMAMSGANGNGDAKMSNGDAVDHVKGEEKEKGDEANGGRIFSTVASKISTAMSGGEGNHGGSGEDGKTSSGHTAGSGSKIEETGGEANGGGLVDQIRASLTSGGSAKFLMN